MMTKVVEVDRKEVLKKALWEIIKKYDINKKFNYDNIVPQNDRKGELYEALKGDWQVKDKAISWEIMQDWARVTKELEHIGGPYWQRLK